MKQKRHNKNDTAGKDKSTNGLMKFLRDELSCILFKAGGVLTARLSTNSKDIKFVISN